jgi:hypothetical protein
MSLESNFFLTTENAEHAEKPSAFLAFSAVEKG